MNTGKVFERQFKSSIPDYCYLQRIPDPPQSFAKSKTTKFSVKNPYDFIMYDSNSKHLFCFELKTTKYKSIGFEDINSNEKQNKMIHKHQIQGLYDASKYDGIVAGFILNFRDENKHIERTYFQEINSFLSMVNKINKKSFNELDLIVDGGALKIDGIKKRVNYTWNIDKFLNDVMEV